MPSLDFPSSPTIGLTTSIGTKTWEWTGSAWKLVPNVVTGVQGVQGVSNQGVQGVQATQGVQGVQATQGVQGIQGIQGVQGVQGLQGLQGSLGYGDQGTQGTRGFQGSFSAQGTQGLQGLQGLTGLYAGQGTQGSSGGGGGGGTTIGITTDSTSTSSNILFVTETGSSGIATLKVNTNLVFDPANTRLGIGTTAAPSFNVDVEGDIRVKSAGKVRFGGTSGTTNYYIQYNSTTDSLDFISG